MDKDKILYQEFLNGNKVSFDNLITKYQKNVIYFISRYVKNIEIAEDIFQEVVLYLLENPNTYNEKYSFKTYLYIVAKSKAINYIKKYTNKETDISQYEDIATDFLLEDIILSKERKIKIQKVMKQLKTDYQIAIYLTQIEGLSYKQTSVIMEKTEKQIKNLVYNAKKTLQKLLIKERMIEMKKNKFIRLLCLVLTIGIVVSGVVFAAKLIIQSNNATLTPSFTGSTGNVEGNKVWVGTFQLVWNELLDKLGIEEIEFKDGKSELATQLNKKKFTKNDLSPKDYYVVAGKVSNDLRQQITTELQNKWNEKSKILDRINWNDKDDNHYLLYAMLNKQFTFEVPFLERGSDTFANSTEKVKYFGLDDSTSKSAFENVEALFYNSDKDFAVKINTKEGEELFLYRTDSKESSFEELYNEMNEKSDKYTGRKELKTEQDRLKIPFIQVNADINYDELCNRYIKNSDVYISQAVQTVDFLLDNYGGHVISEAMLDMSKNSYIPFREAREFNFTDRFVLFMKERGKENPYFALLVEDTDVLVKEEIENTIPENTTINFIVNEN